MDRGSEIATIRRLRAVVNGAQDLIEDIANSANGLLDDKPPTAEYLWEIWAGVRRQYKVWGEARDEVMPAMGEHDEEYVALRDRMQAARDEEEGR